MVILKENPIGIDSVINNLNFLIYQELDWTKDSEYPVDYTAYHRALKNPKNGDGGLVPEVFNFDSNASYGEYTEVMFDDTMDASSFFYVEDTQTPIDGGMLVNTTVSLVMQVKLDAVASNVNHRGDAEIQRRVVNAVNKSLYGKFSGLTTGIANVYSEFDQSQITFTDMHPFHCFRVDIDVNYEFGCCIDNCGLFKNYLLTADGGFLLLEDGGKIIIQ